MQIMTKSINEELNQSDVKSISKAEIERYIKANEFKKNVKEIAADVVKELFKTLWQYNSTWYNNIKR